METLRNFVRTLGAVRLAVLGGVALALIVFFVWIIARTSAPQQALLYGDLDMADAARVVSQLEASAIPYHLDNGGTSVYVAADQVARTRVALAERGLPRAVRSATRSSMPASRSVRRISSRTSISCALWKANSRARSVRSIPSRLPACTWCCHAANCFSREKPEASASVLLQMRGRTRLTRAQVTAVQHLIASAVSGLTPSRISIVDGQGTLLIEGTDGSDAVALAAGKADQRRRELENHLSRTVEQLLERIVGVGKVRAEVSADIDFDRINTSEEIFDPDGQVVRRRSPSSKKAVTRTAVAALPSASPPTCRTQISPRRGPAQAVRAARTAARKRSTTRFPRRSSIMCGKPA
jgi:flagellar M-ring protein FliF